MLPSEAAAAPEPALNAEIITVAEKALAHYLGPLAGVLVKRAARQTTQPREFHQLLAEELAVPAEKSAFLKRVQR
ncbi:MAG: hypothetical protein M3Y13_14540 [Armatimonadota bacterium]|nr:hypothetical protein [Armatimonadota bacterium]